MDVPPPIGPDCLSCNKKMRYARTARASDGSKDLNVFECGTCRISEAVPAIETP